jgi:hypothetical protein
VSRRHFWIAFVLALVFIVVCRLPSVVRPVWNVDEGFTAITANVLRSGGTPYKDSVDHRGPVTYLVYAAVFALAGKNNMLALHLTLIGVVVALLSLLALLATRIMSARGTVFALLYFALVSTFGFSSTDLMAFHTEWLVILFTSLGVLICWRALDRQAPLGTAILCGVCFALAGFTKQPAVLDALATLVFLGTLAWFGPTENLGLTRRQVLSTIAGIVLGGAIVTGAICAFFVARGAWSDFVFYVWTYNRSYYMAALSFPSKLDALVKVYDLLMTRVEFPLLAAGGFLSLASAGGWLGVRTKASWRQLHIALWGVSSLCGVLAGTRPYAHYFIMLLPSWCLLAGLGVDAFAPAITTALAGNLSPARKAIRALIVAAVAAVFLARPGVVAVNYLSRIRTWRATESHDPLVAYIKQHSPSDAKIIVWGFRSDLYILTDRDPATRFAYTTFPVGLIPYAEATTREDALRWAVPGAMDTFIAEFRSNRPLFVADTSGSGSFGFDLFPLDQIPQTAEILADLYEPVPEFSRDAAHGDAAPLSSGIWLYRRRDRGEK